MKSSGILVRNCLARRLLKGFIMNQETAFLRGEIATIIAEIEGVAELRDSNLHPPGAELTEGSNTANLVPSVRDGEQGR